MIKTIMAACVRNLVLPGLKNCVHSYKTIVHIAKKFSVTKQSSQDYIKSSGLCISEHGDPKTVLVKKDIDISRDLAVDELLVKMLMAPINPSDINIIEGVYHNLPKLPSFLGNEGVGEIVAVGSGITKFSEGDWVLPKVSGWGTWRQFVKTSAENMQKIDNDIPLLSAATLSVNPCTAYRMLKDFVPLSNGDYIIQNGANSAVGQNVIQIAKNWGIKSINVIRDRPDNSEAEYLQQLGADHVIKESFFTSKEMKNFLKDLNVDIKLAFNCVGGKSATELLKCLSYGGTMVTYGGMSKKAVIVPTSALIFKDVRVLGYWNTEWNKKHGTSDEKDKMFADLCEMIRLCKLLPPRAEIISLEDYQEAISKALEGFQGTKKVLRLQNEFF